MKRIKVLNVLTGGIRREGITSTQLELLRNMELSNIQMDYVAVHNNDPKVIEEFIKLDLKVFILPDRKNETNKYIKELYKLIKKEKYDIIHVHGSSTMMAIELLTAKICGVKIRIAHSRNTRCMNPRVNRLMRPLFNFSYTKALACGKDAGKWLFHNREFEVIHNGKDLEKFKFSEKTRNRIRSEYNLKGKTVIGFVGKLNKQKNVKFLLNVFAEYQIKQPNSAIFFMGDGEYKQYLENRSAELGIKNVYLTGSINNVNEMIQAMDIMCLPSLYEGLPNVVLEWQIAGLPSLVSSNVTKECKVTELVKFLPIDQGTNCWVNEMLHTDIKAYRLKWSEKVCLRMKKEKFEIKENAKYIEKIYRECEKK